MFREMRRHEQELDRAACERVLTTAKRGVLATNGDNGYPYAVPMDHFFDANANAIYLHSARSGHKVDAIERDGKVCFTTWQRGEVTEDGWSYRFESVIAFGHARVVTDEQERYACAKKLGLKHYPSEAEVDHEIDRSLARMLLIRIDIIHLTGKRVHER